MSDLVKQYVDEIERRVGRDTFKDTCRQAAAGEMKWGEDSMDYGPRDLSGG